MPNVCALTTGLKADIEQFRAELIRCILLAMIVNGVLNGIVAAVLNAWSNLG
jgi:hypothetical protein